MAINWFPGHMNKAKREIGKTLQRVDLIVEVVDARAPWSTSNPVLRDLRRDKPCIKVLNKSDLADPQITGLWKTHMSLEQNVHAVSLHREQVNQARSLLKHGRTMLPADKNPDAAMTVMIVGIPNVGKSTLINILAGRALAKTGNVPAVTRRQQRINLGPRTVLLDTPGILWPRLDPPECGLRLALTGAIKDALFDYYDVALFAIGFLRERYPDRLMQRYKLKSMPDEDLDVLTAIAGRRGCLGKGGVPDLHKVSELIVNEFQAGLLPKVTLELPAQQKAAEPDVEPAPNS